MGNHAVTGRPRSQMPIPGPLGVSGNCTSAPRPGAWLANSRRLFSLSIALAIALARCRLIRGGHIGRLGHGPEPSPLAGVLSTVLLWCATAISPAWVRVSVAGSGRYAFPAASASHCAWYAIRSRSPVAHPHRREASGLSPGVELEAVQAAAESLRLILHPRTPSRDVRRSRSR